MIAVGAFLIGLPAVLGLSYATAWLTVAWISRTCDCDFCNQTEDDLP